MDQENNVQQDTTAALFGFPATSHCKLEQTLCIIKPDAIDKAEEVINLFRREGFTILQARRVNMTAEQSSQFYQDMYELDWFSEAVAHLCSGPILALVLSGPGAILHLLDLLGPPTFKERSHYPGCLRNRFGTSGSDIKNALHGSPNESDALRELHFFFPELIVEPILADNLASYYLNENVHPVLTIGLSMLVREKPDDPVMWLADWLIANNPNKPKEFATGVCQ